MTFYSLLQRVIEESPIIEAVKIFIMTSFNDLKIYYLAKEYNKEGEKKPLNNRKPIIKKKELFRTDCCFCHIYFFFEKMAFKIGNRMMATIAE